MTRLILVDDHGLIRRGMRDALREHGFVVAGEAGSWEEAVPLLDTVPCDVLLLDINLPGLSGLDALEAMRARATPPRALVVSMHPEDPYALKALRAGASGYVCKSADTTVLAYAIQTVARGRKFISPEIAALLAEQLTAQAAPAGDRLSQRERQLLSAFGAGLPLAEVATQLALPAKTLAVYRARLMEKLKLATAAELAQYAARMQA
ncbi:response regulator [Ramlibacter sp.]|uniref:response regulator n=1 Tax=Ramlibacter sp. TaxID=1917967 RepID=UPI003D14619A